MVFSIKGEKSFTNKHKYIDGDGLSHDLVGFCDRSVLLGCQYLGLDIESNSNRVLGVSGYFSVKQLLKAEITIPKIIGERTLFLEECEIVTGTAKEYPYKLDSKFCKKLGCICIGDDKKVLEAFKITEDFYVSILDGKIVAIFIFIDR